MRLIIPASVNSCKLARAPADIAERIQSGSPRTRDDLGCGSTFVRPELTQGLRSSAYQNVCPTSVLPTRPVMNRRQRARGSAIEESQDIAQIRICTGPLPSPGHRAKEIRRFDITNISGRDSNPDGGAEASLQKRCAAFPESSYSMLLSRIHYG